jgi:hypothetical protein
MATACERRVSWNVALLLASSVLVGTATAAAAEWTPVGPDPFGRSLAAVAYDSARHRVVRFGGEPGGSGAASDTWEWDGTAWVNVTPLVSPPARSGHALAYDSARGRTVLFGGRDSHGGLLADTWEWDGAQWVDVTPAVSPAARSGHAMAYDSARGRVVLCGGSRAGTLGDTWEYSSLETTCDGQDDNNDGTADEGCDDDGDGYCDASMTVVGAPESCPRGPGDCDDPDPAVHPGAPDLPGDTLDEDCSGGAACDPTAAWLSTGEFLRCVVRSCDELVRAGLVSRAQCAVLTRQAAASADEGP